MSEARARKELRYRKALEAHGELMAFMRGYRAAAGDDPVMAEWTEFVIKRTQEMMNAAFILGEELEEDET